MLIFQSKYSLYLKTPVTYMGKNYLKNLERIWSLKIGWIIGFVCVYFVLEFQTRRCEESSHFTHIWWQSDAASKKMATKHGKTVRNVCNRNQRLFKRNCNDGKWSWEKWKWLQSVLLFPLAAALNCFKMSRTSYLWCFWWAGSFLRTCGSSRDRTETQTRPDTKTNKPRPPGSRPKIPHVHQSFPRRRLIVLTLITRFSVFCRRTGEATRSWTSLDNNFIKEF